MWSELMIDDADALAFEIDHLIESLGDDFVPVSEHAYHMGGSQIWLEPGEQMTLDDMLQAICISSANDARCV